MEHKRTFYFLEQQIIKANMHRKAQNIESQPDGLDFFFAERSDARGFMQWLKGFSSNITKFKYSYVVDILPICKDDLVIFPRKLCGVTVGLSRPL